MNQPLSEELVAHVANLARIDLSHEQVLHFTAHLEKILAHAGEL